MNAALPYELTLLGLETARFRRDRRNSYCGPCPRCGGNDRFVIFIDRPWPHWNWHCRRCHPQNGWIDELKPEIGKAIDDDYRLELERRKSLEVEQEKIRRQRILEQYTTGELYKELHRRMTGENYAWWASQGIPREWADFWQLGYEPTKTFRFGEQVFSCPAFTIPKFDFGLKFVNMDYRLIGAPADVGKYRSIAHLPAAAFVSNPTEREVCGEVFVVEGSKKAAVVSIRARAKSFLQVIGLPSCNSWSGWEERLRCCERVWVIFDPDAIVWAVRLARQIGKIARVVSLPEKPDDAFIQHGMTQAEFSTALRQAVYP